MKRIAIVLLAATCLLAGCSRGQKFTVHGTEQDTGFKGAEAVKIEYELMEKTLQAPMQDGAFTIKGKVDKPVVAKLSAIGMEKRMHWFFILEKGDISFKKGMGYGTPLNDSTLAFTHRIADIAKQYTGQKEIQVKAIENEFQAFVSRHADDPCAIIAIMFGNHKLHGDVLLDLIDSTSPAIRNDGEIRSIYRENFLQFK